MPNCPVSGQVLTWHDNQEFRRYRPYLIEVNGVVHSPQARRALAWTVKRGLRQLVIARERRANIIISTS